ncbi:MlaD family protein [Nocardia cyriacigeorgica]|uniref:MCE family protein n=1 Tax=Nocardia cyriacigeorgica TaxID=135487 RepID=A0A5R8NWW7_9NOCA|nr:MlaD family protein [Nocardia cyriacigeorgica]TLF80784.1 MCE family protein [Nocardia cyriacigeorgica]
MLHRLVGSRAFLSILGVAVVCLLLAVAGVVYLRPFDKRIDYCATMPDAIGLYVGNDVTLRGIKVGSVTGISNESGAVRVRFTMDADHPLRGKVAAATVSDTLVADRRLAVLSGTGPEWNPDECITETATPKSITQTLDALAELADQLDGGGDPAQRGRIGAAIQAFDTATAGLGPQLNDIITQLAAALRNPDTTVARIGSLIDSLSTLAHSVAGGWGNLRVMLDGLAPVLQLVNNVWDQVVTIVESIVVLLPLLNDITTKYGGPIMDLLDRTVPLLDLAAANVGTLQKLIDMIPVVTGAFRSVTDPESGRVMMSYAPPKVALAQPEAAQICAAINAVAPGRCANAGDGLAAIDLTTLVSGLLGGAR